MNDDSKTSDYDAGTSPVDLLFIGGPDIAALNCNRTVVRRVPFSLSGLKDAQTIINDANLVVFWPDRSIFGIPTAEECMLFGETSWINSLIQDRQSLPAKDSVADQEASAVQEAGADGSPGAAQKAGAANETDGTTAANDEEAHKAAIASWLQANEKPQNGTNIFHDSICLILKSAMRVVFSLVEHGCALIIVVPDDFPNWKPHEKDVFKWFSEHLLISHASGTRVFDQNVKSDSEFLNRIIEAHVSWIQQWPLTIRMDQEELIHPDATCASFDTTDTALFGLNTCAPDLAMEVKVSATTSDRHGNPFSLVLEYGQGGVLVIPPPCDPGCFIDVSKDSFNQSTVQNRTHLYRDTGASTTDIKGALSSLLPSPETVEKWENILGLPTNGAVNTLRKLASTLDAQQGQERLSSDTEVQVYDMSPEITSLQSQLKSGESGDTPKIKGDALRNLINRWLGNATDCEKLVDFLNHAKKAWGSKFKHQ